MEPKKKKKLRPMIIVLIILILAAVSFAIYKCFFSNSQNEDRPINNVTKVTNKIEGYEYLLEDRDTQIFQEIFSDLKENLEKEEINQDAYIESLAKLFIIDLFTLDNKINKYDVGGLDYLYEGAKESFRAKILDTIYKNVEDNSYKTRKQILPIVKDVTITSVEKSSYKIDKTTYESFEIIVSWEYTEDLGYDDSAKIIMIKEEKKLSIVSYEPIK